MRVEDLFTQEQPAIQAAAWWPRPLAYLMTNDFERVTIEKVDVDVAADETDPERRPWSAPGSSAPAPCARARPCP